MKLVDVARALDLEELTPRLPENEKEEIARGYASDLLSDVLANAPAGGVLVTLQVHLNVIAVASHAGLRAVIFSCRRVPGEDVIERATLEGISLYWSAADTFELVGRLHDLGVRGSLQ